MKPKKLLISIDEINKLMEFMEKDTWCGECGLQGTAWGVREFLGEHNLPIPKWVTEITQRLGYDKDWDK